jgi:hypothetical protein
VSGPEARATTPSPAPVRRRESERKRSSGGGVAAFLIAGALPIGAVVWFFLQPQATRDQMLAKIPAGWAGRAAHAGIAFGVLIVLARVALPAFHDSTAALGALQQRMAARKGIGRVLLYPVEALVALLRVLCRLLFAVDALLILACCLVLLLLVARIVKPGILPDILPQLGA